MKPTFVETENVRRFYAKLTAYQERGAREACLIVVDGKPGLGKTMVVRRWMTQTGSLYLRAQRGWDYNWFLQEMLAAMEIAPETIRGPRAKFSRIIAELADRGQKAAFAGKLFGVIIDECDQVSSRADIMEGIRGISDLHFLPTVLVGMGTLRDNLRKFPQIDSRAPHKVDFRPATLADANALIEGRCEVKVAPDLVQFVHKVSNGLNREILDAIANIERFGLRFDAGEEGITLADMAGQPLMTERGGKTIHVPEHL
ncbi:AAA family ATPase [Paenirhodobacter populi]|uniref:ATP-binding protein n=1 Tax=Paenirhodobacter populi TaxID=2306993 RepID=A0A443J1D7_9RHOB|nr:AAA family ATPase [Sinirhodobacter populi]RWR14229.1 ATP-binding protein [Sinirhodobacter populi]